MRGIIYTIIITVLLFLTTGCGSLKAPSPANIRTLKPDVYIDSTRSNPNRPARAFAGHYRGIMIDALAHLDPPTDEVISKRKLQDIIEAFHEEKIAHLIIGPVPNEGHMLSRLSDSTLGGRIRKALKAMDSQRVHLYCGSDYTSNWLENAFERGYENHEFNEVLEKLERDLDDPDCIGMGEIGLYHFNKTGNQHVLTYAPTFKPFLEIIGRIAAKGKWVNLHIEPVTPDGESYENSAFGSVAMLYQKYPDLKLILSHTAMTSPSNLKRLFHRYPNLMVTFKPIKNHRKWKNLEPITNSKGQLYEDWAALFETMPERFLVGTDTKFGRYGHSHDQANYDKRVLQMRKILGSINLEAAKKIAYQNAIRIFGDKLL